MPVRVHLLSAKFLPDITTTLTEKDVGRIFWKANRIWEPAGVQFYIESLVKESAAHQEHQSQLFNFGDHYALESLRPVESQSKKMFHIYYVKTMQMNGICFPESIFVKDTAKLRAVARGLDEPLPRVTAHELGHGLGLDHRQNLTNLMASGTTGFLLNEQEVERARAMARKIPWIETAPNILKKADELFQCKKAGEARILYGRLMGIPLNDREVEVAKQRWRSISAPLVSSSPKMRR